MPRSLTSFVSVVASLEKRCRGPTGQRADVAGGSSESSSAASARIGARAFQDVASLRGTDRGRSRARARRVTSRMECRLPQGSSTRVLGWRATSTTAGLPPRWNATGARLFRGEGKLTDPRTITVGSEGTRRAPRAVVIATAAPRRSHLSPASTRSTSDQPQAAIPTELPVSLAILGWGGPSASSWDKPLPAWAAECPSIEAGPTFLGLE